MLVIGQAGAGKTTLLRRWVLKEATQTRLSPKRNLPVYIALRHWRGQQSIANYAQREVATLGGERLAKLFGTLCQAGRITLILDGLDEVPFTLRERACNSIKEFEGKYSNSNLIISTRYGVEPAQLSNFLKVEVVPFDQSQIQEII